MGDNSIHIEGREPLLQSQRILRVYEGFTSDRNQWALLTGRAQQHRDIVNLFASHGFSVIEGGELNIHNPLEFGISNDSHSNHYERDRAVALKVGIEMPQSYTAEEILRIPGRLVAKVPEADRGELKYLLETPEQKVKFIAWGLLYQQLGSLSDRGDSDAIIQRIFKKVSEGDFTDPFIEKRGWLDTWVFEEYVQSPGDYNTSIRIVADALGVVHYGQVARSDAKKDATLMNIPSLQYPPLEEAARPGSGLSFLLSHPESPFYIAPKKFVSNIAEGGKPLLLNGQSVEDQIDRKILEDLGIDPDRPEIPKELTRTSRAIGREYRKFFPHVGVDYMVREGNRTFVLLEVNKGPNLRPEALGLPSNVGALGCELELMRRLITEIPA